MRIKSIKRYFIYFVLAGIFALVNINKGYSSSLDPGAIGIRSLGMGSAMVGIADDLISAFYYNPAGLVQLKGTNMAVGSIIANIGLQYKSPEGYRGKNTFDALIPFFAYATDVCKPIILGVGMYSTLGVGFEFRSDPAHGIINDIKSKCGVMFLSPTIAYRINPKLSLGVELNIGYGKSEMDQPTPVGYLKTDADGFGFGATIGLLYKVNHSLNIGLCWRSPMQTSEDGDAHLAGVKDDLDMDLYWPQMLTVGIGYKFTPDFIFGLSLKWSDWSYFDRSKMKFDQFSFLDTPLVKDTRDGFRLQMGGEYWLNENIALRAGYLYDRSSLNSHWISPGLIECSFHEARVGIGIIFGKFQIDMAFNHTFFETRRVSESSVGYPGKYYGNMPAGGIEMTYHF